jgi:hypothetical protein
MDGAVELRPLHDALDLSQETQQLGGFLAILLAQGRAGRRDVQAVKRFLHCGKSDHA